MARGTAITNLDFADRVGCSESMASLLLGGLRTPSDQLMERIGKAYRIPWLELVEAKQKGGRRFGRLLRDRCQPRPPSQRQRGAA